MNAIAFDTAADEDIRSIILLNEMGDVEVAWASSVDDRMRTMIEKKMKEGVRFFILKPMAGGALYRKSKLRSIRDLKEMRVKIGDEDFEKLFAEGHVSVARAQTGGRTIETERPARTADEVIQSRRAVGVRAFSGG